MPLEMNRNVFITCAVTGSGGTQDRSPHVPRSPQQIANAAIDAAKAGAAVVHCHVRDPETGAVVLSKSFWQKLNILLIWVLVVTALARPEWAEEPIVREKAARDLLLVVDLSGSMEAKDFTGRSGELITRLDAVKEAVAKRIPI